MKNVFDKKETEEIIDRINKLEAKTQRLWGKMSVSQMLAHCNVTYEHVYDNKHPKPGALKKTLLKWFVKPIVVGEKPYAKNSRTSPEFIISHKADFEKEKTRLINYLHKTQEHGKTYFEQKDSGSFGKLTSKEWNTMFYKHLNHHLSQFGV
jgi:hypothetical protein